MKPLDKTRHRINWINGMKINKNHFVTMEDATLEMVNKANENTITPINYGLLPQFSDQESALDVLISVDGQSTIEVVLNSCHAITLSGCPITITQQTSQLLEQSGYILKKQYSIHKEESEWYVVLRVNDKKRVAVGNSDTNEEPPRRPYVFPQYKLDILPKNETSDHELGSHFITIGKILLQDGKTVVDSDFIPPCRSVQSHPDLKFTYSELGSFLNQMESFSLHIIQKIHQKKQSNNLANVALYLSEQVMRYLNEHITEFRCIDKYEPPIHMISKLVNLGRVIKSSLDVFVGTGKEDFLNYLTNWCDLNQGAFEKVLIETIELQYTHNNINLALIKVSSFTKLMFSLFKKLNELDYIGEKDNSSIFVKEEVVDKTEPKGRRSFLLD
ncbi:type VI secretion system baseplate subunit TssK [Zobellia sp.]|nr:type VI secretion system baseplate subunit TssK [Zobellia sp.]